MESKHGQNMPTCDSLNYFVYSCWRLVVKRKRERKKEFFAETNFLIFLSVSFGPWESERVDANGFKQRITAAYSHGKIFSGTAYQNGKTICQTTTKCVYQMCVKYSTVRTICLNF
jgi:hypothetical protein